MKSIPSHVLSLVALSVLALGQSSPTLKRGAIVDTYSKLPLIFEQNEGQTDGSVKFLSRGSGYTLFLTPNEAVFSLRGDQLVRMKLVGSNPTPRIGAEKELSGKANYFIGSDPKKWHRNVPTFGRVKYEGVYPGVDLIYYGDHRQLEYDFVVAPGADVKRIAFDIHGAKLSRSNDETLDLITAGDKLRWQRPIAYQEKFGIRHEVDARYMIRNGRVKFKVGRYDPKIPLIIDPALSHSTYLGGSGYEYPAGIAVDSEGSAYLTGYTTSTNFPTMDPFQPTYGGGQDAFIVKFNAAESGLVYSTYLGGSGYEGGSSIAVDPSGNTYVTGFTNSSNFPITPGAFQSSCTGYCAFVTKLDPSGSALIYSTYFGGAFGGAIAVNSSGNAYITGGATNIPTTPGAFQPSPGGTQGNAFVTQFDPTGSTLIYSTYIGGSGSQGDAGGDSASGIALDNSGSAYIAGFAGSSDFPTTPGAFQPNGGVMGFVSKFNASGSDLDYSTYLGGNGSGCEGCWDSAASIAVDSAGDAFVTGQTYSSNFPTTPGAFQASCANFCGYPGNAFVTEFNPSGFALVYSTYLGGTGGPSPSTYGARIALDSSGSAYVTGSTGATGFPTTPGAFQTTCVPCVPVFGGSDAFLTEFNASGSALIYSTYLGGSESSSGSAVVVDSNDNVYVAGNTSSTDFPTTPGAFQTNLNGASDVFLTEFVPGPQLWPLALNLGNQVIGSTGQAQNVTLTNEDITAPLSISSIKITGANQADFSQTNNCPIGGSLAPGTSCTISVTFTPKATGVRNASVTISDSAPHSPQHVGITGTGTAPTVTFSPMSLTFGPQPVNTTSPPLPVMLSTNGTLTISSITTSDQFSQTNNCGTGLPAGGSCTINVTFTPANPGVQNGTLMVTDSATGSPQSIPLSGTGTQPAVTLSPPSLNFGNQTVNFTSKPLVSTLTNTGNGTMNITSIVVMGTNHNDFVQTNNCPRSLTAGSACQIQVTFKPSNTGNETASVSVTDDAPGSPQSLPLSGMGVLPAVSFSPTSLTFPTQVVFSTSEPQKITLTNTGLGVLKITGGGISGQFGETNNCAQMLSPGASCTISVVFKPTTKGTLNGTISVADNAPNSPQKAPLTGTGTYVQLSPTSVNFGTQPVQTTSLPKTITLTNKGSGTVNFTGSGITITGADAGDFAQKNNCGTSVARGASCFIKVTFTPSQQGKRTADVSINDDGGGSPQIVPLTGTGTP